MVEHKKDYRRRAAVTHERKKQKQKLLEAAFFRNPDEFDRRMVKDMKVPIIPGNMWNLTDISAA